MKLLVNLYCIESKLKFTEQKQVHGSNYRGTPSPELWIKVPCREDEGKCVQVSVIMR